MRNRLIIEVSEDIAHDEALNYVQEVIKQGLISDSKTCYCYATRFTYNHTMVTCHKIKTGFKFNVWIEK